MSGNTKGQTKAKDRLLAVLREAKGAWVSGKGLGEAVGTTDLHARLASLRYDGWVIESRTIRGDEYGFKEYKLRGRGAAPGRTQLNYKLSPLPKGHTWTEDLSSELAALFAELEAAFMAKKFPVPVEERDSIDAMLAGEDW